MNVKITKQKLKSHYLLMQIIHDITQMALMTQFTLLATRWYMKI